MICADVDSPRPTLSRMKGVNVVAPGRQCIYSAGANNLVVSLTHPEDLAGTELRGLADDFEIADARLAFEPHGANARVWMTMWGKKGSGFKLPLDYEEGLSSVAHSKLNRRFQTSESANLCSGYAARLSSRYHGCDPVQISLLPGSRRVPVKPVGDWNALIYERLPIKLTARARWQGLRTGLVLIADY